MAVGETLMRTVTATIAGVVSHHVIGGRYHGHNHVACSIRTIAIVGLTRIGEVGDFAGTLVDREGLLEIRPGLGNGVSLCQS